MVGGTCTLQNRWLEVLVIYKLDGWRYSYITKWVFRGTSSLQNRCLEVLTLQNGCLEVLVHYKMDGWKSLHWHCTIWWRYLHWDLYIEYYVVLNTTTEEIVHYKMDVWRYLHCTLISSPDHRQLLLLSRNCGENMEQKIINLKLWRWWWGWLRWWL